MKNSPMNKGQFGCEPFVLLSGVYMGSRRWRAGMRAQLHGIFRTANENDMRLSAAVCTANIAAIGDGEWALISPYGDHPSPDGSYVQHLDRDQAEKVVKTWNSITGKAARVFKNMWHGLGAKYSAPVWDGHPETDKRRWPAEKLLAEISDVRAGEAGLEGLVTWNAKGNGARARGPLFPSALWWHWPPAGDPPTVFPELLESIGLVPSPNISGVPAWTANANFAGESPAENQTKNMNHRDQLIALLGLKSDATDAAIQSSLDAHGAKVTSTANALSAATTAKTELETQLSTANTKVDTLTSDLAQIKTANTALITERDGLKAANEVLVKGTLDLAEKKGAITPAERETFKTRITTANTAEAALTELQTRKAMSTSPIEINGSRVDLSTANSRADALTRAVQKRMKDEGLGYDAAFAACQADTQLKPLFDAMKPAA